MVVGSRSIDSDGECGAVHGDDVLRGVDGEAHVEAELQRVVPVRDEHRRASGEGGRDVVGLVADDFVLKLPFPRPVQQLGERRGGTCG